MSLEDIADLVGGPLDSAYRYQAWWANESDGRHVQARSWRRAGHVVTTIDLDNRRVTLH